MIRCSACGHLHQGAFTSLDLIATLGRRELIPSLLAEWPSDRVIEVRACAACREGIARTAPLSLPKGAVAAG
jgi:hypothetical protein